MNRTIARLLNRGARLIATLGLSLLVFGLIQMGLTHSPIVAHAFAQTVNLKPHAAPNTAPKISVIPDQNTNEDVVLGPLTFYVSDSETAASALTVTTSFSNPALVSGISQTNSGVTRTLLFTPTANAFGSSLVTVTVSDGISTTDAIFTWTVAAVNDAPTISAIADQSVFEDSATSAISFTVGDVESPTASLQLTATTNLSSVIPLSGIVFGGSGSTRTVTLTPLPNASGVSVLITVLVSDGITVTSQPFSIFITPTNDAPTISDIADQMTNEDTPITIPFAVTDVEVIPNELTYTLSAANPALIGSYAFSGNNMGARSLVITPALNTNGSSPMTVTVSDGISTTSDSFVLTMNPVNDAPQFLGVSDVVTNEDVSPSMTFVISDVDSPIGNVSILDDNSNNAALVSNVTVSGNTATRTVNMTLMPNASGTAQIKLTAQDDGNPTGYSTKAFTLTVNPVNDPPAITMIGPQSTPEDTLLGPINFSVSDPDSGNLTVTASSSNPAVVANANIAISPVAGGNGGRSLTITPAQNAFGTTQITVLVNDGQATTQTTFTLTVSAVNDPPAITLIPAQSTPEDTQKNVTVTFSDVDGDALTPFAVSANPTLVPNTTWNLVFSGSGNSRTLTILPAQDQIGSTLINVTVRDATEVVTTSFLLTVTQVNDAPTIGALAQQNGTEDTLFSFGPITVNDIDSPVNAIVLTATSANPSVVPNGNISFGGSGNNRTISFTPQPEQSGLVALTIYASDGQATTTQIFNVDIKAVNDAPTISGIANTNTPEDTTTGAIGFTVGDIDTAANDLQVSVSSSNPALVPNGNITPSVGGTNRTLLVTPLPNQNGSTVIVVTVRDGPSTASASFTLDVIPVNDAPTISVVPTQFVTESTVSPAIPFTVTDLETAGSNLIVTAVSSNQNLIQNSGLTVSASGNNRTLTIRPVQYQNGAATVTLTVRDPDGLMLTTSFLVTVDEVNDPPTITEIVDMHIAEDGTLGPVLFQINDLDTPANALGVTATTSNGTVVPLSGIQITGSGTNRALSATPLANQSGFTTINMVVTDGSNTTSRSFNLYVDAVNDAPKITPINAISMTEDTPRTIAFTVSDVDNSPASLQTSAVSSNPALLPIAGIGFAGNGPDRTVTLTPALNQNGTTTVTITVSDGSLTDSTTFVVTVNPVNDAPTITTIANQAIDEDTATAPIIFSVNDVESLAANLQVTVTSSNPDLVPLSNIALSGTGSDRSLMLTPLPDQNGNTTIALIVTDEDGATTIREFILTVTSVNDKPVISEIGSQEIVLGGRILITFTVKDVEWPTNTLHVIGTSSNPSVIPTSDTKFQFSPTIPGGDPNLVTIDSGTVTLSIVPNFTLGSSRVAITVDDGTESASREFTVYVVNETTDPTFPEVIPNQTANEDTPFLPFEIKVTHPRIPAGELKVTATSANPELVANNNIQVINTGGITRTLLITPTANQYGNARISLAVSTGSNFTQTVFTATIMPIDDPPSVSAVQTKTNGSTLLAGVPSKPMTFTVGDPDTPLPNLQITVLSSNPNIIAPNDIGFNGTGITRTMIVKSKPNRTGKVTLTVQVSDAATTVSTSFDLVVGARVNLAMLFKNFATCDSAQTDCSEPNNALATAHGPIALNTIYTGTSNGTTDRYDHYTITLEAEVSYTFKIEFPAGDLDLFLYGSAFASAPLIGSAKNSSPEQFEYRPRVAGLYYILVYGYENGNATNRRYTLQVKQSSGRGRQADDVSGGAVESVKPVSSGSSP